MKYLLIVLVVAAILVLLEIWRELHCFQVTEYVIESQKLSGCREKKIVFLSDLHNHMYGKENQRLIEKIKEISPELILVGGDMLIGKRTSSYEPAMKTVKALLKIAPVYYAHGNHEQRMKEFPDVYNLYAYREYQKELKEAGVRFLENESVKEGNFRITGLEIPLKCYLHCRKGVLEPDEITSRIGACDKESFQILLAHHPSYMEEYKRWGADLILSGHYHGGVVRIPGFTGMITPAFEIFPKYSGDIYREGDTAIVVSKGLGTHTVNVRFLNPAELVVLRLRGKN